MWRILGLLTLTAVVYGPAFGAGFVYEDENDNGGLHRPWTEFLEEWRGLCPSPDPANLTSHCDGFKPRLGLDASYRFDAWMGGSARQFHATSIGVHVVNVLLLYAVVSAVAGLNVGWFAAALLAVHPLGSEAVAYVAGRGDALAATGVLIALCGVVARDAVLGALGMLAGVILAFWAKEVTAASLVLLLPIALAYTGRSTFARWNAVAIVIVTAVAVGTLRTWATVEWTVAGSRGAFILQQAASAIRLARAWLIPVGLSIELPSVPMVLAWLMVAGVIAFAFVLWPLRSLVPHLAFACAWGAAVFLPRVLMPRWEGLHERHAYVALLGWAWASAAWLGELKVIRMRVSR